ncbi:MAG TPA: TolC family protein [Edaphobacter sp.]|uniref:TolC family protein n=1 Tax=Edaphobacter sp. TaxID=1934404 RepID=UPI002CB84272|nr:TolC family protein [Edaphobacter sp.]HUZ95960.1 TolC family protein [Edaphobacter sp.]
MNRIVMRQSGPWLGTLLLFAYILFAHATALAQALSPAPQAPSVDPQNGRQVLLLDDVIQEALNKNPEAQSALHAVKALERRVPQAKALPDPVASVGWAGNLAPFSVMQGDNSSYRGVTVSEQFPYPGKLKLRGEMASKEADAAQADYEAVRRRVTVEVKAAYYDYFYFDRAIQTTNRNKDLLEKLSKIAEARYRVGKATQQDVLRSQVEISLLIEKLTVLEQQRETAQARINVFLVRSPESPLPPAANVDPATIRYSLDELYALAGANDTGVLRNQRMVERGRLGVALAQKEYRPDIGVGYMYQQRSGLPDMNGVTFSVNIPVFFKSKQRQGVAEASEDLISAEKARDNRLNEVRFELKQQYLAAKASERLFTLYAKGIVPQSSLALESSMASYQVGNVDFLSLIANFTTLLDYETDYYRQLADYQTALARIESLTGSDVTGPAVPTLPASIVHPDQEAK